jgi:hypothetical protein
MKDSSPGVSYFIKWRGKIKLFVSGISRWKIFDEEINSKLHSQNFRHDSVSVFYEEHSKLNFFKICINLVFHFSNAC